jgi:hypothetical protein
MTTIQKLDGVFDTIVTDHKQLNGRYRNSVDEVDFEKVTVDKYPLLYAQVTGATIYANEVEYEYEVVVASIVMEKQEDTLNDVYNETCLILQDVIAMLHMGVDILPERIVIDLPISSQPFNGRFTNLLAGWGAQVNIRVPSPVNLCHAPYS